jgi:hypothetical protein
LEVNVSSGASASDLSAASEPPRTSLSAPISAVGVFPTDRFGFAVAAVSVIPTEVVGLGWMRISSGDVIAVSLSTFTYQVALLVGCKHHGGCDQFG